MSTFKTIRIGTRSSALALWQTHHVADLLREGGLIPEIISMETQGDKVLDRSLSKIGSKGLFTAELEESLVTGQIDIAVHSAKDLPSELGKNLEIIAFTQREMVNDVVISFNKNLKLADGHPWVIGTSSTRRIATLRHYYPHLTCVDMRGNLQTRIRKLQEGNCDALILAYAGVHRMNYDAYITELLPTDIFTPAVGQGSIAIEASTYLDPAKRTIIRQCVNHLETELCLRAERAFLHRLQGGCSIPAFALATLLPENGAFALKAGIISLDGKILLSKNFQGEEHSVEHTGYMAADDILASGGRDILYSIRN